MIQAILLNLMPCVFPMLAIKLLGLVNNASATANATAPERASVLRKAGLFYTLGVLASMWALAGSLLALRASGRALGWGFQLQSPLFVATLALLFFVMGFVFLGKLTIDVPARLLPARLLSQRGNSGEFFAGVLSTVVATPCSAPFMATAIGYALAQPLAVVWTVFTALGLGLALPFLALSLFPSLLRFLPRPGSWMVTLKEVLAFPLFASTVWLIWVFAQQTSLESVAVLLLVCVGLGAAGWAWQSGRLPKRVGVFTGAVLSLCSLIALFLTVAKTDRPLANAGQLKQTGKDAFTWIAFEPGLPEKLAAEGRTVFVDYTASWCLTCKVNERVVFGSQAVREKLAKEGHKLALVRADWTNEDAAIGYSLAQFGRSGVPLYLVYGPNAGGKPEVLPQILTPSLFLAALERAAASP